MKVAINAWFEDIPSVGSGQYLKYLLPALLEADDELELILVSPKPFKTQTETERLRLHHAATPFPHQTSNLAKLWFEQITFPRACQQLDVDVAHVPYFGSSLSPGVPTVVTIHDLIPMVLPAYRGSAMVRLYTALVAAAALSFSLNAYGAGHGTCEKMGEFMENVSNDDELSEEQRSQLTGELQKADAMCQEGKMEEAESMLMEAQHDWVRAYFSELMNSGN